MDATAAAAAGRRGTGARHPHGEGDDGAVDAAMSTGLGFIGTGTITHAIVTGLCNAQDPPPQIWVSPRSNRRARELAASYPNVHVASSNQEVLDRTDTVMLAVLP